MTPLWTENISILYEKRYIFEVLPNKKFDFNRKLNSLLRLSIYYTIISIVFCNMSSSDAEEINMWVSADATTEVRLLTESPLPAKGTFIWNDKIMLSDTDELIARLAGGTGDVDVLLTYIEQRWA